jgi:predicted nucleic acid-binding protein
MILADTSIWIDHLRKGDDHLVDLLNHSRVTIHPFVLGELACGNLRNRQDILRLLRDLPRLNPATDEEVLYFIEKMALMGQGIGYIDAHLLAAVTLSSPVRLWTRDKRLLAVAGTLGLDYQND